MKNGMSRRQRGRNEWWRGRNKLWPLLVLLLSFIACDGQNVSSVKMNTVPMLALTRYVNPFIGTASGGSHFWFSGDSGDTFPGATYPLCSPHSACTPKFPLWVAL